MQNEHVVEKLRQIGQLYTIERDEFRSRSYFKVAAIIERLSTPLASTNLIEIKGIGKGTEKVIRELEAKGTCDKLERLLKKYPPGALTLQAIPGVGPVNAYKIATDYGVTSIKDLIKALEASGADDDLLVRARDGLAISKQGRLPRAVVEPFVEEMTDTVRRAPSIDRCEVAGSYRRGKETIKDIDVLVQMHKGFKPPAIRLLAEQFGRVQAAGSRKISVRRKEDFILHIDFLIIAPVSWGAALCYFTGSKEHNVRLRGLAKSKGLKVNEYGIYKDKQRLGGTYEKDLYELLGLEYVEPENRAD